MKRLFAAIKINPSAGFTATVNSLVSELRYERIKWVETGNMHLTLKFFGETEEKRIPAINAALKAAASKTPAFTLRIGRTGIFGSRYDPRVIWFGIDPEPTLQQLAADVFAELEKAGWEPDRQNFVPHLTIGRIKELKDRLLFQDVIQKYRETFIQEQPVYEVILYESILQREGPQYIALQKFPLLTPPARS
ncbi:MAG TPA: RNA 2',3'-cyclic phosphodiesterase [Bacteroidales bacterium]|nr:RNA 2',3'-cyclic phosphodiesterase [Bacteroidales bacterium]HPT01297.1 RNA 2',3'-cyclic phosphodiesterase [Bacteroidales bacterium]